MKQAIELYAYLHDVSVRWVVEQLKNGNQDVADQCANLEVR